MGAEKPHELLSAFGVLQRGRHRGAWTVPYPANAGLGPAAAGRVPKT